MGEGTDYGIFRWCRQCLSHMCVRMPSFARGLSEHTFWCFLYAIGWETSCAGYAWWRFDCEFNFIKCHSTLKVTHSFSSMRGALLRLRPQHFEDDSIHLCRFMFVSHLRLTRSVVCVTQVGTKACQQCSHVSEQIEVNLHHECIPINISSTERLASRPL